MKKMVFTKDTVIKGILIGLIICLVIFFIWANFFYFKKCTTQECFDNYLAKCSRAIYVNKGNITFEFKILNQENDICRVNVKLLRGDLTNPDSLVLKEKSMKCGLPVGVISSPVDDISLCHGLLKEGLQDLIIKKMHTYIVQNLDRINFNIF